MNKQERSRHYQDRVRKSLQKPHLQDTLHRFADAYVIARDAAFAGHDFEALRVVIAEMKDQVRDNLSRYQAEFIANAEAAGATVFLAKNAAEANAYICNLARERGVKKSSKARAWRVKRPI